MKIASMLGAATFALVGVLGLPAVSSAASAPPTASPPPAAASAAPSAAAARTSSATGAAATSAVHASGVGVGAVVGEAPLPGGGGFWSTYANGAVVADGTAVFHGDMSATPLNKPVISIASTADGKGYWLVASDGGIFTFGDAHFYGSTGAQHLNKPIVGMAATAGGGGYWMVASDGGIFTFGNARYYGSTGAIALNKPIVAMTSTPDGKGYWMVATDGGIFTFGDAGYHGSTGAMTLSAPIVGMATTTDGRGYWLVGGVGNLFAFGDAVNRGSAVGQLGSASAVGIITDGSGYWILSSSGSILTFAGPKPVVPTKPPVVVTKPPVTPGKLPVTTNPAKSIQPSEAAGQACFGGGFTAAGCDSATLVDLNKARVAEGYGPLPLPANYESLGVVAQIIATANAERTSRGLPSLPQNATLDGLAAAGAKADLDPTGPSGYAWGSNISDGYPTPLSADFAWMYNDGLGGTNGDCTTGHTQGCWGHRDNILSGFSGESGAAVYNASGVLRLTELFVAKYP